MIQVDTFLEMLREINDLDFILKVIQAEVVIAKGTIIDEDLKIHGNYVRRLEMDNYHNGLRMEHYQYALKIFDYEQMKSLGGLGGSQVIFPKRQDKN